MTEDEDVEYTSGPYCPHYSQLDLCDDVCTCSHTCRCHDHDDSEDDCRVCREEGRKCPKFTSKETP